MNIKTLDKYDFESTIEYMQELGVHIANETNGKIRVTVILSDSKDKELSCCSTLPNSLLFRMLLATITKLLPANTGEILREPSKDDLFERLFKEIRSSE